MIETSDEKIIEITSPVLLEFAMTVYICQSFESSLCFLLSLMEGNLPPKKQNNFQNSWDFHSKKTLGTLLKFLQSKIDLPQDVNNFLSERIKLRNQVVHGYLIKNGLRFANSVGRHEMIIELTEMRHQIKKGNIVINEMLDVYLEKYGTSSKQLKENVSHLFDS